MDSQDSSPSRGYLDSPNLTPDPGRELPLQPAGRMLWSFAVSPAVTWPLTSPGSPQDWDQGALFLFIYLFKAGGCLFVYGHAWRLLGILVSPPGIVPGPRK